MLTIFTTAKPFKGHVAVIQRNALKSWTLLHPDVEIILFGDDQGSAEAAKDLGIRHEPDVGRNEFGTILVSSMFQKAQAVARYDVLCYVNSDIILLDDFPRALKQVKAAHSQFLMAGRRWDVDIAEPIDFSAPNWQEGTRRRTLAANHRRNAWWIDYFAFSRGLYGADAPPFAIGRTCWDNWLIWKALEQKKPVIDASRVTLAIHQNHDYSHHPQGKKGVWKGQESRRNYELAGDWTHLRAIGDATEVATSKGLKPNSYRHLLALRRLAISVGNFFRFEVWHPIWFSLLDLTRPIRTALGLRSEAMRRSREKT
jgi:hypothetical protein